ncbi:Putative uncharacterized protein YbfG [Vanrija pseudolonga]|uniref:Uncharacterized protein n=1 Tax=Vanrija pseudolonga TaxID=143232 RepID=A0AAF0YEW4_9TREE|nr:Putative uncharacterized protein YbfG [Vanrija pseudolonga]
MRPLAELLSDDPALPELHEWIAASPSAVTLLPAPDYAGTTLQQLGFTTGSFLGTLAYSTGGMIVDYWLRIYGGGSAELPRKLVPPGTSFTIPASDATAAGMILVGDDVVGGFFALDGGVLGNPGKIHYLAPDALEWENLELGHGAWVASMLSGAVNQFYASLRWPTWKGDMKNATADKSFSFYPPLWTKEGSVATSDRRLVPVTEVLGLKRV